MDWDRRRYDDRRGGESYRPSERPGRSPSRGYDSRRRSPPRNRSRPRADTWVPSHRSYGRPRSRSPEYRRRSRTPPFQGRGYGPSSYSRRRSPPRRFSPRRDDRTRTPPRAWRSRSPLNNDIRPREMSRGRNTPKRVMRDPTPSSQDFRTARPASPVARNTDRPPRAPSPVSQPPLAIRPQNIADAIPREPDVDKRERPSSRTRQEPISPVPVPVPVPAPAPAPAPTSAAGAATESGATSRRSSPSMYPDRSRAASTRSHSRSPFRRSPSFRPPTGPRGRSPYRDSRRDSEHSGPRRPMDESAPGSGQIPTGPSHMNDGRSPGPIPTQPRNANLYQQPPSGPSQGPKMGGPGSGRGPQNMSLLSAPTRPRRGPGSRDSPWSGPPMARRGPPASPAAHSPPVGPRASFSGMSGTGGGHYRHPGSRQHSIASGNPPPRSKSLNHLAGMSALVPGGKALPSILDPAAERRLVQLEADRERLFEQVMTTQKIKRAGLRDWDRVDRESSICALKSELAEGHLQRMAEESSIAGGVLF